MSTETTTETREFIIVGQDQGASYTLWDVAPAPTDATKRATALEEIEIDAFDAFGSVHTEHATSARAAVDQLLAELLRRSGLDEYPLSPDSRLEAYQADPEPQPATAPEPYGTAYALSATRDAGYLVKGSSVPGTATFAVDGLPVRSTTSTRDRVRAGVINSGLDWPMSNVLVKVVPIGTGGDEATSVGTSGLDLAIACAVLAAAGQLPGDCLAGVAMVGELGLDGGVRLPYGQPGAIRAIAAGGTTTVLVPNGAVEDAATAGVRAIGVGSLDEALAVLAGHWHHPQGCAHCADGPVAPHQPCTPAGLCPTCQSSSPAPF
ncbi:magnesium chelatase domain-containing protein [Streptomyces sp. NPDC051664]|uniref:magnesium chelatase domain-containing protein n=1 Tax=Streptomyces sp. NPDC051664 TaxID=3365668 RepID=UPI0037B83D56